MITTHVQLNQPFKAGRQFTATSGTENQMLLGDTAGAGPKCIELVAVGLAGCAVFDVITILRQKYHQSVGAMVKRTASCIQRTRS